MNDRQGANPYGDLSRRTSAGGSRKGLVYVGVAVVVVGVLAAIAVLLTGGDGGGPEAVQEVAGVEAEGDALSQYPDAAGMVAPPGADPAVSMAIPTLVGEDFDGEPMRIDGSDGRAKVLVFLAHWCPHCQAEVPRIQDWVDGDNLPDDVDLVAISTSTNSDRPNYPPSKWLDREGWTAPVLLDDPDSTAASAYGLTGFPFMVFVDSEGLVTQRTSGELPIDVFGQLIDDISGG